MDAQGKSGFSIPDMLFIGGLTMVAVLIPGCVVWVHFFRGAAFGHPILQWIVAIPAALLAVICVGYNLHTSFIRPWLYRRSHGDLSGYQYVSGVPVLGSILIGIAALFFPCAPWIGGLLLVLYLMDPGGLHFAAFAMLRECFTDTDAG